MTVIGVEFDQGAPGALPWPVNLPEGVDSGEREYTHVPLLVTAAGDTVIYTPALGNAVRLHWIYAINSPAVTPGPLIRVKFGTDEKYCVWAVSKRQQSTGPVDAPLIINLSAAGQVAVTAILEEITP